MKEEKRRPVSVVLPLVLLVLLVATIPLTGQSNQRAFAWFAELVSVDRGAGTVTVRAPFLPHVARYIDSFEPGDPIVAVWTQLDGEADVVLYVERHEIMTTTGGYIVHAELVGVDLATRTVTFTVPAGTTIMQTLASAAPGTPIRLESPMRQTETVTEITSVTLDARPRPRPAADAVSQILADPNAALANVAGGWLFESDLAGNTIAMNCMLTQHEAELSGTCEGGPGPASTLTGAVEGNTVRFTIAASFGDNDLQLSYSGVVASTGARMEGDVSVMGFGSGFKGTKQ